MDVNFFLQVGNVHWMSPAKFADDISVGVRAFEFGSMSPSALELSCDTRVTFSVCGMLSDKQVDTGCEYREYESTHFKVVPVSSRFLPKSLGWMSLTPQEASLRSREMV
jgi:hypothetical protein